MADLGNAEEISDHGRVEEASVSANSSSNINDGFQELLELAEEYKAEEAVKMQHSAFHVQDESCLTETNGQDCTIPLQTNCQFDGIAINATKSFLPETLVCQTLSPSSSVTSTESLLKVASGGVAEPLQTKMPVDSLKQKAGNSHLKPASAGTCRSNFTVPYPFSLSTDKRASFVGRPRDENDTFQKRASFGGKLADGSRIQLDRAIDPLSSLKMVSSMHPQLPSLKYSVVRSIRSESIKHQEEALKKLTLRADEDHDDTVSFSSRQSSEHPKARGAVLPSNGFKFHSDTRAEKRKEFYFKLQEKQKAKEDEKNEIQAKTKKEMDEEIKLLRRSLTFRASPMPDFYQEGPPPKTELKKIPTTRAVSPKFTRRKSHPDDNGFNRICKSLHCEGEHIRNESCPKPLDGYPERTKCLVRRSLSHLLVKRQTEYKYLPRSNDLRDTVKLPSDEVSMASNIEFVSDSIIANGGENIIAGVCFDDTSIKAEPLADIRMGVVCSDENKSVIAIEYVADNCNGKDTANVTMQKDKDGFHCARVKGAKGADILPILGRPTQSPNTDNITKCNLTMCSMPRKMKDALKAKLSVEDNPDMIPGGPRQGKKERLKALTPYFRKQNSVIPALRSDGLVITKT